MSFSPAPTVSLIVVVRNAERTLGACLASLARQSLGPTLARDRLEVIIVDNGSSDGSALIARRYASDHGWKVVEERERFSIPAARNRGLREARGELIAFTDADCIADANWLARLCDPLLTDRALGAAGGRVDSSDLPKTWVQRYIEAANYKAQFGQVSGTRYFLPWISTSNAVYRRTNVIEAGGFDVAFTRQSDVDLTARLVLRGHRIAYVDDAIVRHQDRADIAGLWRWRITQGRNVPKLYLKYRRLLSRPFGFYIVCEIAHRAGLALRGTHGWRYYPLGLIDALAYGLGHTVAWLHYAIAPTRRIAAFDFGPRSLVWWNAGRGLTAVDLSTRCPRYCFLNSTGRLMWELSVDGTHDLDGVIEAFHARFGVARERLRDELGEVFAELGVFRALARATRAYSAK